MGNKVPRHAFCSFSNQIMEATKDVLFYAYLTLSVAPLLPVATPIHHLCCSALRKIANICAPSESAVATATAEHNPTNTPGPFHPRRQPPTHHRLRGVAVPRPVSFAFLSSRADKVQLCFCVSVCIFRDTVLGDVRVCILTRELLLKCA